MAKLQSGISICLLVILLNLYACENSKHFPILGSEPVPDVLVVENHSQALAHWAEQGVRDAVIINLDEHADIRSVPESKIVALQEIYNQRDWDRFRKADSFSDNGLYHIGNWIYAGARLGIISEVYWVIPHTLFSGHNREQRLRQFLLSNLFSLETIETFRFFNGRFRGSLQGIPITLCSLDMLPNISEPILLSIDIDFFPEYSHQKQVNHLASLHDVFEAMFSRQYRVEEAVVSFSVNGEYLAPHLRWIGDTADMILKKPQILAEPPSDKLKVLQHLDNAYRSFDFSAIRRHASHYFTRYPEASVFLYKAYAHLMAGESGQAYEAALVSCNLDKKYCSGLPYIGTIYFMKGEYAEAEKYFRAGLSAAPWMSNGLYCFANCLRETGNFNEALIYYSKAAQANGSFPAGFLVFETCLLTGDRHKVVDYLKDAVSGLVETPYAEVGDERVANAIYTAIDYADDAGLNDLLGTLQNHRAVKHMYVNYPR